MTIFEPPTPLFGPPSTELPKPPVPYTAKWRFTATSHTVPDPTPVVRNFCINSSSDMTERRELSPLDRCLKHPPMPGKVGSDTVSLEVIDLLKVGDGHNSQVFTVRLLDFASTPQVQGQVLPQKGTVLVAKMYDPLYFNDDEGYLNPFLCMDKYHTHEANAYLALDEVQGQGIPRSYGSYVYLRIQCTHGPFE